MPFAPEKRTRVVVGALYVFGAVAVTAIVLHQISCLLQPYIRVPYTAWLEATLVVLQVPFQLLFLGRAPLQIRLRYGFALLSLSLFGACLLIPVLLSVTSSSVALVCFTGVVGVMILAHTWLLALLGLPRHLSLTWILYRALIVLWVC